MQASTKHSPFELLYGRPAVIPIQNCYRPKDYVNTGTADDEYNEPARQLLEKTAPFNDLYENARMNLHRAQERQQRDFLKRHIASNRKTPDFTWKAVLGPAGACLDPPCIKPEDTINRQGPSGEGPSRLTQGAIATWANPIHRLQPGDFVMIKNPHKKNKLDSDLLGPYKFVRFTDETYTVAILQSNSGKGWKESVYNISPF